MLGEEKMFMQDFKKIIPELYPQIPFHKPF